MFEGVHHEHKTRGSLMNSKRQIQTDLHQIIVFERWIFFLFQLDNGSVEYCTLVKKKIGMHNFKLQNDLVSFKIGIKITHI